VLCKPLQHPKTTLCLTGLQAADKEDAFFKREAAGGKLPKFASTLKYSNISAGSRLWGMVLEVGSRGLTISLPQGLRGIVPPDQVGTWS
jgi:hypothetical protein